jgi:hypothetical protein
MIDGQTHYDGCWESRGHHECAMAEIRRLREICKLHATSIVKVEVELDRVVKSLTGIASCATQCTGCQTLADVARKALRRLNEGR